TTCAGGSAGAACGAGVGAGACASAGAIIMAAASAAAPASVATPGLIMASSRLSQSIESGKSVGLRRTEFQAVGCDLPGVEALSLCRLTADYSASTATTPGTALIAPAICGETLKRPGSFTSTSVPSRNSRTTDTSPSDLSTAVPAPPP